MPDHDSFGRLRPEVLAQLRRHKSVRPNVSRQRSSPPTSGSPRDQEVALVSGLVRVVTLGPAQEILSASQELKPRSAAPRSTAPRSTATGMTAVVHRRVQPLTRQGGVPTPETTPEAPAPVPANAGPVAPVIEPAKRPEPRPVVQETQTAPIVYRLGEAYIGERVIMSHLGLDIGTKTIVVAFRDSAGAPQFISELNGYWLFERPSQFIENMLNDPNRRRSDGTQRPARWIKLPTTGQICVLGRDAEEFAFAKNDSLLRPMAEGGISADEEAMTVLASIVQGLLETAEHDVGKFSGDVKLCYCTTAPALNKGLNIDYHERVVDLIIGGYESKAKLQTNHIKESHAIVMNEDADWTGIGISWGAGTVTVSVVKQGMEIFSFSWVGAGDWIDDQVARRHGYDPQQFSTMRKTAKETPTTVARRKTEVELTPGKTPTDRLGLDIVLHYDVLINNVLDGIVRGFAEHEAAGRFGDEPVRIYLAGGTASPVGFERRVAKKLAELALPFKVGSVVKSARPLYSVAEGCLKAAELF